MCRDEDDSGPLAAVEHEPRHLEAGHPRQLDVEKDDVVADAPGKPERLSSGRGLADHLDLGMGRQQVAQLAARRLLVVHDQRANAQCPTGTSRRTTVPKPPDFRRTPSP